MRHTFKQKSGYACTGAMLSADGDGAVFEAPMDVDHDPGESGRGLSKKCRAVLEVLACLKEHRMSVFDFMDALSWGDYDCVTHPSVKIARRMFLQNRGLRGLLARWWKPPRPRGSTKPRAQGARETMVGFAFECVEDVVLKELRLVDAVLRPTTARLRREDLTKFDLDDISKRLGDGAPMTWGFLMKAMATSDRRERAAYHSTEKVSTHPSLQSRTYQF